jgi:hypothetical protein
VKTKRQRERLQKRATGYEAPAYRDIGYFALQGPGWLLLLYLIVAQAIPAFDYELGVAMGTQESAAQITAVGTAFFYGFAFGDLIVYIPLLAFGLIGHARARNWGRVTLIAALGITIYWPVVCLAAAVAARGAPGWNLSNEGTFWLVLPPIAFWAAWGTWRLSRELARSAA